MRIKDRFIIHKSKYFYMLVFLIGYSLLSSIISDNTNIDMPTSLLFAVTIILSAYIIMREKVFIYYMAIVASIALISYYLVINTTPMDYRLYILYYVTVILFLSLSSYTVLYSVTQEEVTADTLFGAICGYLLIGLTWSFAYLLIETIIPGSFSKALIDPSLHRSALNAFYFSFTTMTTLGYGDYLPISYLARTCSWLEAVMGQIYLAVWISQLVGLRIMQRDKKI